jgi:pimeloyl-ACP methyl ester carboxylesterase
MKQKSYLFVYSTFFNSSNFNHSRNTVLLVHGFGDSGQATVLLQIKNEMLKAFDVNLIVVDWQKGAAAPDYFSASSNTRVAAERIAKFLNESNIDQTQVHCIGHSLGAHTCGFAGKITKFKRITGLDPAGPFFSGSIHRLNSSDAE